MERCPKTSFAGKEIIDLAVAFAVLNFNDGGAGLLKVMKRLKLRRGVFVKKGLLKKAANRIHHGDRKSEVIFKNRRKFISSDKKGFNDTMRENEGKVYLSGAF